MTDRSALGPADVADSDLAAMLGADAIVASGARTLEYDLAAMTTGGRWWVDGVARRGGNDEPFTLVVKVAQSVLRSPVMSVIPQQFHAATAATLPWQIEPAVYRSTLDQVVPDGLRLPTCLAVRDLDDESAAIWLEAVPIVDRPWTVRRAAEAAHTLGRLAARPDVWAVADEIGHPLGPRQSRSYLEGRLSGQYLPAYADGGVFEHPVVARHVDSALRARLMRLIDAAPTMLDEIEALPLLAAHGDACPNNLLAAEEGTVAIDWAFFCRARVGFDLSQLLMSEIELGRTTADDLPERQTALLDAYRAGLAAEGFVIDAAALHRAHALQVAVAIGIAAVPLEQLDDDPATLDPLVRERARALDHLLTSLQL